MMCECAGFSDADEPQVYQLRIVKARKKHICCECRETIGVGRLYEVAHELYDGHWMSWKTCLPCSRIRSDLCRCGYVHGELRVAIQECLGMDYLLK